MTSENATGRPAAGTGPEGVEALGGATEHQSPDALELLGPKSVLEVQQRGRTAARAGEPVTSCPWRHADTPRERAEREAWIRGYAAGRTDLRPADPGGRGG